MANVLSSVSERRLRPIYEQLDNGYNKKAIHEAEKLLKKQKDLLAAKVLKVLALHRLGKEEEAFVLSKEVVALDPKDENSLQGLTMYYKEIERTDLIIPLYEKVVKHFPNNEEYLTHLFMAYSRHEEFHKMQQVAMTLSKHYPTHPYFFWAIMSLILQAEIAENKSLAKNMFLPLAERMIETRMEKIKLDAEPAVRLYLVVLEMAEKYEKALEVLKGPIGEIISSELGIRSTCILRVQEKAKMWATVNVEYKRLLKQSPDVWNYALGYLDSFFHLFDENYTPESRDSSEQNNSNEQPDCTLDEAYEFIKEIVEMENEVMDSRKKRGPYLLRLEMMKRLRKRLITFEGSCSRVLLEYALDFSNKPCCFHDLVPYLPLLSRDEIPEFIRELYEQQGAFTYHDMNGDCSESLKRVINRKKEKEMHRHIFTIEATRYLGLHDEIFNEEKMELVSDYMQRHRKGLRYCLDRPPTDGRVADAYCLFAVRVLLDRHYESDDIALLWRCVSVLEYGLSYSPFNYEMKFMLIRIYCRLGIFLPCKALFESLEIKHIQHDTLGYTVNQHALSLGHFQYSDYLFQVAKVFYTCNYKECSESLIAVFRNGCFAKVSEIYTFRRRVKNSLNAALCQAEHTLMNLFTSADNEQPIARFLSAVDQKRLDYDKLEDNRDFSYITDINNDNKGLTQADIEASFREDKDWLLFRELLIRCLHLLFSKICSESSQPNGNATEKGSANLTPEFDSFLEELEKFCTSFDRDVPSYKVHGPNISKLHLAFKARYPESMLLLFKFCRELCNTHADDARSQDIEDCLSTVINHINDLLKSCCSGILVEPKPDDDSNEEKGDDQKSKTKKPQIETILSVAIPDALLCMKPSVVERLVLCVEMFSLTVVILTNMQSVISDIRSDVLRRRRRKKGKQIESHMPAWLKRYQEDIAKLKSLANKLISAASQLKLDADSLLLDFAKYKLNEMRVADDDTPLEDGTAELESETTVLKEVSHNDGADGEPQEAKDIEKAVEELKIDAVDSLQETKHADKNNDDSKIELENEVASDSEIQSENTEDAAANEDASRVNGDEELVRNYVHLGDSTFQPNEEDNAVTATTYKDIDLSSSPDAKFEKIIKSTSESLAITCKELLNVVERRLKNLNDIRV